MASKRLIPVIYRKVLKATTRIDKDPALRAMVSLGASAENQDTPGGINEGIWERGSVSHFIFHANGESKWYVPDTKKPARNLTPAVREAFRAKEGSVARAMSAMKYCSHLTKLADACVSDAPPPALPHAAHLRTRQLCDLGVFNYSNYTYPAAPGADATPAAEPAPSPEAAPAAAAAAEAAAAGGEEAPQGEGDDASFSQYIACDARPSLSSPSNVLLLLAHPLLAESAFRHCVMVVVHHKDMGTVAFILNHLIRHPGQGATTEADARTQKQQQQQQQQQQPSTPPPQQSKLERAKALVYDRMFVYGGPVHDAHPKSLHVIHTHSSESSHYVGGGLYLSALPNTFHAVERVIEGGLSCVTDDFGADDPTPPETPAAEPAKEKQGAKKPKKKDAAAGAAPKKRLSKKKAAEAAEAAEAAAAAKKKKRALILHGMAAWETHQLRHELELGTWIVAEGGDNFSDILDLWLSSGDTQAVYRQLLMQMESESGDVKHLARIHDLTCNNCSYTDDQ